MYQCLDFMINRLISWFLELFHFNQSKFSVFGFWTVGQEKLIEIITLDSLNLNVRNAHHNILQLINGLKHQLKKFYYVEYFHCVIGP